MWEHSVLRDSSFLDKGRGLSSTVLIIFLLDVSPCSNLMWSPAQSNFLDKILRSKTWNSKSSFGYF